MELKHLKQNGINKLMKFDEYVIENYSDPMGEPDNIAVLHPTDNPNNISGEFVETSIKSEQITEDEESEQDESTDLESDTILTQKIAPSKK